jgi:hypothetical protein
MIVAPIPVYGRGPLLTLTISRLINAGVKVICIGHDTADQERARSLGADWVLHDNEPLGAKWNAGFMAARKYEPSGVLFVGSSDWVSDSYIKEAERMIREYDLLGKLGCHFTDIGPKHIRTVDWHGYKTGARSYEPIGIGRVLSPRILNKLNWQPFDKRLQSGLDWSMWIRVLAADGNVGIFEDPDLKLLSISTHAWGNKHKFEDHWTGKLKSSSTKLGNKEENEYMSSFPEIYTLQKLINQ